MTNLRTIVHRNSSTFYDYRSKQPISVIPKLLLVALFSSIIAALLDNPDTELVSAVITVQSILVGFGFSVLFFLVNSEQLKILKADSLEKQNKTKRLNKLSDELFYNVSYYNLVTIFSVLLALAFLLPTTSLPNFATQVCDWLQNMAGDNWRYLTTSTSAAKYLLVSLFYFLFIESIFTFYRIVIRINFYFSQKLDLRKSTL